MEEMELSWISEVCLGGWGNCLGQQRREVDTNQWRASMFWGRDGWRRCGEQVGCSVTAGSLD